MTAKQNSAASTSAAEAGEVFRQFAWHLAGSIVAATGKPGARPSKATAKATAKR